MSKVCRVVNLARKPNNYTKDLGFLIDKVICHSWNVSGEDVWFGGKITSLEDAVYTVQYDMDDEDTDYD